MKNTSYPSFEVIIVDDASTDGSGDRVAAGFAGENRVLVARASGLGVAGARNLGAQIATGEILIFLDGHSYTPPGWMPALAEPLQNQEVGMVGPAIASLSEGSNGGVGLGMVWRDASLDYEWLPRQADKPYSVPLLPGGCQVMRKADFAKIGCFDSGMTRWGSEDLELSFRTWLMGYRVLVQPQAVIYHLFRKSHPYQVETSKIVYNRLRLALLHFQDDRAARVLEYYKEIPDFGRIMIWLLESDVMERRRQLQKLRSRDDEWFFSRFACEV